MVSVYTDMVVPVQEGSYQFISYLRLSVKRYHYSHFMFFVQPCFCKQEGNGPINLRRRGQ